MDDNQNQDDGNNVLQFLKNNPDVHQKIIDQKMQQGSIFDQQSQNPAVQQNYQQADPKQQALAALRTPPDATTMNMVEGMAAGTTGPLTGIVKRGLAPGLKLAEEAAPNFGKVIMKNPGENAAQAYARVKGLMLGK